MKKVLIVGAGLAGCTVARVLAERGFSVSLIEKRNHIGGQCYDHKNGLGITVHDYGPHIFHTESKVVWDFVNRFSAFNQYVHRVLSCVDDRFVPFPINRNTINTMFGTNITDSDVRAFFQEKVKEAHVHMPPRNFEEAMIAQIGIDLYRWFIYGYTKKQWECEPNNLNADLAGRIAIRENDDDRFFTDAYQGLPVGGYTYMLDRMVDHPNISVHCDVDFFKDKPSYENLVFTGRLDEYFGFCFGELTYRSLSLYTEDVETGDFQPTAVVNYPGDEKYTRITEFKKMTGESSPKTTIMYEIPARTGDPFYIVPDRENQRKRELYMGKVAVLESEGRHLFVGRLAEYKYYNMDQVILRAMERTRECLFSV